MTYELLKQAEEEVSTIRSALKNLGYLRIEEVKGVELMELIQALTAKVREQEEIITDNVK